MKNSKGGLWIGDKDLNQDPEFSKVAQNEFNEVPDWVDQIGNKEVMGQLEGSRRDFLKILGFGLGAATVAAGCEIPVKRAIPYVIKPDEIVPGVASYYASSFVNGGDFCSVLVKTREGRPIKVEGNHDSPITGGGTSARAQASVLDLYNIDRIPGPKQQGELGWDDLSWDELDSLVKTKLGEASNAAIVTSTILSPTTKAALDQLTQKYPSLKVYTYDPVSSGALLKANEDCFGQRAIADYHFDKADVIVGINADFLGTWISPIEYAQKYIQNRKIKDVHNASMSRHIQVESHYSLTGSNADNRVKVRPSEVGGAIAHLYNAVASQTGGNRINAPQISDSAKAAIDKVGEELVNAQGKSVVVCGTNNWGEQVLVNRINDLLGNIGQTMDFNAASLQRQGDESEVKNLVRDLAGGIMDAVIFLNANPVYELPNGQDIANALSNVDFSLSLNSTLDETSVVCSHLAPDHHYLESWGDAEPKRGHLGLIQPTISPLFNTRQAGHSFLVWAESADLSAEADQPYYEYLKSRWMAEVMPNVDGANDPKAFWDMALHNGVVSVTTPESPVSFAGDVASAASKISQPGPSDALEISFVEKVGIGGGQYATNPWLQEMPDPVTRCTWGNYLGVPLNFDGVRKFVGLNKLNDGDVASVSLGDQSVNVPVIKQFGQPENTVTLALGYGRTQAGRTGSGVGVNAMPWLSYDQDGFVQYYATGASVSGKMGKEDHFSCVQYHHTLGVTGTDKKTGEQINADEAATVYMTYGLARQGYQGSLVERSIIRRAHVDDVEDFSHELEHEREHHQHLNDAQIYPGHDTLYESGHHWGMHVDLNGCIGCGACAVACIAENNVPVVGKKEVSRHHEMTWLRIDRYYYGDVDNPNVVYQPMMCQHCDNAPCENVCPVNATNHSSEGLNQMAYNRCVGTRYCANNCPYKVRRFNWLDYTTADLWPINEPNLGLSSAGDEVPYGADNLTRMVLNPDVTVRSRGVIEKCSFCVQRIQSGKLTAKAEGRQLLDSDVKTACQTACPTGAITFGDMNNPEGELNKKLENKLNYIVLEEVNARSSVNYQSRINNRSEEIDA